MKLESAAFGASQRIPDRFTKQGGNISPPLSWDQVPAQAAELVLLCEDPDAPDGTFLHWLVTGIDPAVQGLSDGQVPEGAREWANGFGETGWGGPQPPSGDDPHRYIFHLFALAGRPELPSNPDSAQVHDAVKAAGLLDSATFTGVYSR